MVGVGRLTRLWAEDVRLQAVLMTVAVAWLASPDCETPPVYIGLLHHRYVSSKTNTPTTVKL